jgi:hypothetical protein
MFGSKAGFCQSEAPFRGTAVGLAPGHTHKHYTRLYRPARDKNSSLLGPFVNSKESVWNTDPRVGCVSKSYKDRFFEVIHNSNAVAYFDVASVIFLGPLLLLQNKLECLSLAHVGLVFVC